jgi:hypothetical protein
LQSAQRHNQISKIGDIFEKKISGEVGKNIYFQILQSPLIPELSSMANDMELIVGALKDAKLDKVSSASG